MCRVQFGIVDAGPDYLLREDGFAREELPVLRRNVGRIGDQRILFAGHQFVAGTHGCTQIGLRFVRRPWFSCRGIVRVIFSEGAFIEADTGFECQCDVSGDLHGVDFQSRTRCAVRAGEFDVFEYLAHHVFATVARLVKRLVIVGIDRRIVPGHCPESLDLVPIEIGTPETGDALVVSERCLADGRLSEVVEKIVDVAQILPIARSPARLVVGIKVVREELVFAAPCQAVGTGVARGHGGGGRTHRLQKAIDVGLQIGFVAEIARSVDFVGILLREKILAGTEERDARQEHEYLFHRSYFLQVRRKG